MILLDTDHVTILRYADSPRCLALQERLQVAQDEVIGTTAVTLEEQMRGWLAEIAKQRDFSEQVSGYAKLVAMTRFFGDWIIQPFDERAAEKCAELRKERIRIGTPDLKIASIALVNGALLLSANLSDFHKVPGLRIENWLE